MALTPSLASRFIFHRVLTIVDTQRTANYSYQMIELIKTDVFDGWLRELRDMRARAKIEARVRRLSLGNPGDVKPVGKRCFRTTHSLWPRLSRLFYEQRASDRGATVRW